MSRSNTRVWSPTSSSSSGDDFSDDDDDQDAGKSFGELALMSEDAVRNASIIADEGTDLLVIDRKLFNGTLKSKQEAEYLQRRLFVRKCPLFRNWSSKFRRLCEMSLRKETFPFDSVLIKQGDPVIGLHFIVRGQGNVTVDPVQHKTQYPKLLEAKNSVPTDELIQYQKREQKVKDTCQREQIRVRRRQGYAAAEKRLASKAVTLCYVDESEILGDTELLMGLESYSQTVTCTANTEVFILDHKNIERLIYKKNPHTMDMLRQIVEDKVRSRACMRVGSQIQLYKQLVSKIDESKPKRPSSGRVRGDDDDGRTRTIVETAHDREIMLNHLSRMFIQNKVPFIEPRVPGSLYYLNKSSERAQKRAAMKNPPHLRKNKAGVNTGEVRLQRARRAARRQARSRRELERLTLGSDQPEMKQLKDNDHAVNRFLSAASVNTRINPPSPTDHSGIGNGQNVFELTEPPTDFSEVEGDQIQLGYQDIANGSMQRVVLDMTEKQQAANANRSKIICSMIEKKANQQPSPFQQLTRPKSAPNPVSFLDEEEEEEEEESFDWETSNSALKDLEDRIKSFYSKYDRTDNGKKNTSQISELKRFNIQGPDDVPIPGGTVYVRQKLCEYPGSTSTQHHQHVRRYMIPKDAYRVAVRSLSAVEGGGRAQSAGVAGLSAAADRSRGYSGTGTRKTQRDSDQYSRIKSAPMKRSNAWS